MLYQSAATRQAFQSARNSAMRISEYRQPHPPAQVLYVQRYVEISQIQAFRLRVFLTALQSTILTLFDSRPARPPLFVAVSKLAQCECCLRLSHDRMSAYRVTNDNQSISKRFQSADKRVGHTRPPRYHKPYKCHYTPEKCLSQVRRGYR